MKHLNYFILIAIFAFIASCNSSESKTGGKIVFKEPVAFDFGKLEYAAPGIHKFVFQNAGEEALVITNVVSSCGCTVPVYPSKPLSKGTYDTIKVQYDTRRVGAFSKSIKVHSTAADTPVVLRIKGEILPPPEKTN